ncbi:hypothetical protein ACLOJK_002695 [Asimina triloba]
MANALTLPTAAAATKLRLRASASMAATTTTVAPAIIIGGGRVGRALQSMGTGRDVLVGRGERLPLDFQGPIFVCTRNDDLDAVLQSTPQSRWNGMPISQFDLGFLVSVCLDMLSAWIGVVLKTLPPGTYFAVSKLGEPPTDGKTDTNPEGLTAAFGKWASAVASRLSSGGLSCKVLEKEPFKKQMLEKLIWISAFMLVGARHPGASVGTVEKDHRDDFDATILLTDITPKEQVTSLIAELASAAAAEYEIVFDDAMDERLCAYSRAVAHFPTAVKEASQFSQNVINALFKWRNGWFYSLTEKALAEGKSDPCPLHTAWLKELKIV